MEDSFSYILCAFAGIFNFISIKGVFNLLLIKKFLKKEYLAGVSRISDLVDFVENIKYVDKPRRKKSFSSGLAFVEGTKQKSNFFVYNIISCSLGIILILKKEPALVFCFSFFILVLTFALYYRAKYYYMKIERLNNSLFSHAK